MSAEWKWVRVMGGVVFTLALSLFASHRAEAVIERIYTLPFYDSFQISGGFIQGVHSGIDYDIGVSGVGGEAIVAAAGGTAKPCPFDVDGAGNYMVIDHGNGHRTRYLHLRDKPLPPDGQIVSRGELVGYEGSTGDSTGPHLHFETRHAATTFTCGFDGTAVDPYGSATYMWTTDPESYATMCSFNGDGWEDLAAGAPGEDIGSISDAGAINVLYGSSGSGLGAGGNQVWYQGDSGILGVTETGDSFGEALACGDFDGDGFDDLAVGAPGEDIGSISDAGAINVLYGSGSGLSASGNQVWWQGDSGILGVTEAGDRFGAALAVCDFDGDGFDDLAVGAPGEDIGSISGAGAINVLYGSGSGLGASGNQVWYQGDSGILGVTETGDSLGEALACGDLDGDGKDDLAVGAPGEDIGSISDAGAINVLYGTGSGLGASGNQVWWQGDSGILGVTEAGDSFGEALAVCDFDGDGFDDLAVGAPVEDIGSISDAGAINVLYGSSAKLTAGGNQVWYEDVPGVVGNAEAGDSFGAALACGDFDGDGKDDLAIGAPGEDVGSITDAGGINVLYGTGSGLAASGSEIWHQDIAGVVGNAEAGDSFGAALAVCDFDGDGRDDLAVGAPGEGIGSISDAGAINVLYGSSAKLTATGDQQWWQGNSGILGVTEADDSFGAALAASCRW